MIENEEVEVEFHFFDYHILEIDWRVKENCDCRAAGNAEIPKYFG